MFFYLFLILLLSQLSLSDASVVHASEPKLLFTASAPAEIGRGNAVTISPDGKVLYATSMDGTISGFDPVSGTTLFQYKPAPAFNRSMVCRSGISFYSGDDEFGNGAYVVSAVVDESLDRLTNSTRVVALRHPSGDVLWISNPLDGVVAGTPKISSDGNHVFLNHNIRSGAQGIFTILLARQSGTTLLSSRDSSKPYAPLAILHNPAEGYFPGGEGNTNDLLMWATAPSPTGSTENGNLLAFQFPPYYGGGTSGLFVQYLQFGLRWRTITAPVITRNGYGLYVSVTANRFRAWVGEKGDKYNAFMQSSTYAVEQLGKAPRNREQAPYNSPVLSSDASMMFAGLANSYMSAFHSDLTLAWKKPLTGNQVAFSTRQTVKSNVMAEAIVSHDNKVVYFSESAGWLHAVRASDGMTIWEQPFVNASLVSEMSLAPDGYTLFLGDNKGSVSAWSVGTPQPICSICIEGSVPVLAAARLNIPGFGANNCQEAIEMGKLGTITKENCYTIQLFAKNTCGCKPITTSPTSSPSLAPTMAITDTPSQVPTATPTIVPATGPPLGEDTAFSAAAIRLTWPGFIFLGALLSLAFLL